MIFTVARPLPFAYVFDLGLDLLWRWNFLLFTRVLGPELLALSSSPTAEIGICSAFSVSDDHLLPSLFPAGSRIPRKLRFLFSNPYLYLHGIFLTLTHLFLVQAPTQYGSVAEFPIHRSVFDGWLHPRFFSLSECGPSHTNRPSVMLLYSALLIFSKYYVCA